MGVEIVVLLKNLNNFLTRLDMPLINCKLSLTLTWSASFMIRNRVYRRAVPAQGDNPVVAGINNPTSTLFKIKDARLYVRVVTFSTENDNKLLEQLKTGFKRTIK